MTVRPGVPAVAILAGVVGPALLGASPALADVTVSPPSATQGSGENLTFHVTNTGTAPIGTVSLRLPADTPVAEAYPLSVDDWAPKIEMRTLSTPLATIHGGSPATRTAAAITWLAVPGHALAPGAATDLSVAIGPLPDLSTMRFTVVTTYADGKPGPVMPPAALTLTPAPAGQAPAGHAGHGGTVAAPPAGDGQDAEDAEFTALLAQQDRGPSVWSLAGWVVAALAMAGGVLMVLRARHRADDEPEPEPEPSQETAEAPEPVSTGRWSYRG